MPKKLDDMVQRLISKGYSKSSAWAIAIDKLGYKKQNKQLIKKKKRK